MNIFFHWIWNHLESWPNYSRPTDLWIVSFIMMSWKPQNLNFSMYIFSFPRGFNRKSHSNGRVSVEFSGIGRSWGWDIYLRLGQIKINNLRPNDFYWKQFSLSFTVLNWIGWIGSLDQWPRDSLPLVVEWVTLQFLLFGFST